MSETNERLNPRDRAAKNPRSLKMAIRAKCWDCVGGDNADPGWMRTIHECCVTRCPLHGHRPYQDYVGRRKNEEEE